MKKFNLKEAKMGAETCTKDGKPIRILAFDRDSRVFPIVALIDNKRVCCYTVEGRYYVDKTSDYDIMMV